MPDGRRPTPPSFWKEARDWTTCIVSVAAPIMIGVGAMTLKNQRLEIAAEMRNQYVLQDEYKTEVHKLEGQDSGHLAQAGGNERED
jgi:hypothetical protein